MNENNQGINDELTLKQLFNKISEYILELKRYWWVFFLFLIFLSAFLVWKEKNKETLHFAEITFMVNEESGNTISSMDGLLGQLGFGGESQQNLDKLLALSKSEKIVYNALFSIDTINSSSDYLANHIINIYALGDPIIPENPKLNSNSLTDSIYLLKEQERNIIKKLYRLTVGNKNTKGLVDGEYDANTGIISFSSKTTSPDLSISLINTLFEKLSSFYVDQAIERNLNTYTFIKSKADSISRELSKAEYAYAGFLDGSRGLWNSSSRVREADLRRNVEIINAIYLETTKNLTLAAFNLKNSTPYLQVLDSPFHPLQKLEPSPKKVFIKSIIISLILFIVIIIGRKIILDIIKE